MRSSKTCGYNLKPQVFANVTVQNISAKKPVAMGNGFWQSEADGERNIARDNKRDVVSRLPQRG